MSDADGRRSFREWLLQPRVMAPVVAVGIALLVGLAVAIGSYRLLFVDQVVAAMAHEVRSAALTPVMLLFTWLGDPTSMVAAGLVVAAIALALGRRAPGILFAMTITVSSALSATLKLLLHRARPDALDALVPLPGSYAFPSGHAMVSGVFFALVAMMAVRYLPTRPLRVAGASTALACAALVGASRVYLGVHWASDVVAGWALAAAIVLLAGALYAEHEAGRLGGSEREGSRV